MPNDALQLYIESPTGKENWEEIERAIKELTIGQIENALTFIAVTNAYPNQKRNDDGYVGRMEFILLLLQGIINYG